jgi:hypothetical protein
MFPNYFAQRYGNIFLNNNFSLLLKKLFQSLSKNDLISTIVEPLLLNNDGDKEGISGCKIFSLL